MELLLGAVSSLLIEFFKWINKRFGKQVTKRAIYLALFALSLIWTVLIHTGVINEQAVKDFFSMLLYAIGIYEILIKNLKAVMKL